MKQLSVIGFGRSGEATALLAAGDGFKVLVSDSSDNEAIQIRAEVLIRKGIDVELGIHSPRNLDADIIVVSPGVPLSLPLLEQAKANEIPVISEIEFAFRHEQGRIIAITGSNGKSTTATLTSRILENAGYKVFLAGNIGNPYSAVVTKTLPGSITVLELSSFQLEAMDSFHPHVAVLLNLSPDHMDRYNSLEEYYKAKLQIFNLQNDSDYAVFWADQPKLQIASQNESAKILFFSSTRQVENGADIRDAQICRSGKPLLPVRELGIPGPHNLNNALASIASIIPFQLSAESISDALRNFKGIEHRLERFLEHNGVLYVNDSKATNPDSLRYALLSFNSPIILIAGGYDKGSHFSELTDLFSQKVKAVIFTGDTGARMASELEGSTIFTALIADFQQAVHRAISMAREGDVVMLSPGCASFDAFENFEHRGNEFKRLVKETLDG